MDGKGSLGFNAPNAGLSRFNGYLGSSPFALSGFQRPTVLGATTAPAAYKASPNVGNAFLPWQLSQSYREAVESTVGA